MCPIMIITSRKPICPVLGHLYRKRPRHQRRNRQVHGWPPLPPCFPDGKMWWWYPPYRCIYGMGNPADFYNNVIEVQRGKNYQTAMYSSAGLVDSLYTRNDIESESRVASGSKAIR